MNPKKYFKGKIVGPKRYFKDKLVSPEEFVRGKSEELVRRRRGEISLGTSIDRKEEVGLPLNTLSTHMHVIGATGVGKSKFLEHLIRLVITMPSKPPVIVIDPHGVLYRDILKVCAVLNLSDRVVLFDPSETDYIVGYNPMARDEKSLSYQVLSLLEACRKVWGQETFNETPRLARWLYNTIDVLIEGKATFLEAMEVLDPFDNPYRNILVEGVKQEVVKRDWHWYNKQKTRLREERTESALSRLRPFLENEYVARILTQQRKGINLGEIIREGKILLVNLEEYPFLTPDDASMLGTILVNDILAVAFGRSEGERRPIYLFVDEFNKFVTKDICAVLDGGRKFGLHLILAHQHLGQLREKDPEVYFSTLTNARTKVIFGGLINADLDILVKEIYTGEFNPDEIKLEIYRTVYDPVESSRMIVTESSGSVTHQSVADSIGSSGGTAYLPGHSFFDPAVTTYDYSNMASVTSSGGGESYGRAVAGVPFYEYHQREELSSVQFRSLEEQLYKATAILKRQPERCAAVKVPGRKVELIRVPTLKDIVISEDKLNEFKEKIFKYSGYYSTKEEIEKESEERRERLRQSAGKEKVSKEAPAKYTSKPLNLPKNKGKKNL